MSTTSTPAATSNAPKFPEQVTGMYILAEALRRIGIKDVYGLVGIPVTEVAYAIQKLGRGSVVPFFANVAIWSAV